MRTITLAPGVKVADLRREDVVLEILQIFRESQESGRAKVAAAIHVGGLNHHKNGDYLHALDSADLVYADGVAVVILGKLAGARFIERAATTDIGIPILEAVARDLGRNARLALVGGPPGLAESAANAMSHVAPVDIVYVHHGFHSDADWATVLGEMSHQHPDVVLIGLGAPRELTFAISRITEFPPSLLVTCGGWFGFIAGLEPRASLRMQRLGLEWARRLAHRPTQLAPRYVKGAVVLVKLAFWNLLRSSRSKL